MRSTVQTRVIFFRCDDGDLREIYFVTLEKSVEHTACSLMHFNIGLEALCAFANRPDFFPSVECKGGNRISGCAVFMPCLISISA